jgi:hypothetical protein
MISGLFFLHHRHVTASVVEAELAGVHFQVIVFPLDGRRKLDVVSPVVSIVAGHRELGGGRTRMHHHHHRGLVLAVRRVVPHQVFVRRAAGVVVDPEHLPAIVVSRRSADPDQEMSLRSGQALKVLLVVHRQG